MATLILSRHYSKTALELEPPKEMDTYSRGDDEVSINDDALEYQLKAKAGN